jgi:uncharacterized protein (TIGR03000 family)
MVPGTVVPGNMTPTPALKPADPIPPTPTAPKASTGLSRADAGSLTIWVPEDAKVFVNGHATTSTGSRRQYVSYGLKPGLSYNYEVRAEVIRDGQAIFETRSIMLTAGSRSALAFNFDKSKSDAGLASIW